MTATRSSPKNRYRRSLAAHLEEDAGEEALAAALDLGRSALVEGRTLFDVMAIHQSLVPSLVKSSRGAELHRRIAKAGEFLTQAVAPFEMINRGWHEIAARLRGLNESLERQVVERTAALRESEQRFRDIAEVAADWIWETDRDHRFTFFAGESLRNMAGFGATPQITLGQTRSALADGDPGDEHWRRHKDDLDARRPFRRFRYSLDTPTGVRRYMSVSGKPIFDPKGEFLGYRGTATDETGMVEALRRTERAEALLQDALASIAEGFVIYDSDDRFVMCNETYRKMYAFGAELLVPGTPFSAILRRSVEKGQIPAAKGREAEWFAERLRQRRQLKGSIEQQLSDGRWVLITERRMASGGIAGLRVDISALKSAQEALGESEQMARGMIETALDAFVQMDEAGNIIEWNPQAEATFGWSRHEAIGKPLTEIIPPTYHTHHQEGVARFLKTGKAHGTLLGKRRELEALRRDGREIKIELAVTALHRRGGYVFNGFLRDITERHAAETRLQALQMELLHVSRLSAMGEMGSALAHEINQPLAAILNYLKAGQRMLETSAQPPADKIREIIGKAIEQAARAGGIIRHLREFITKGETERRAEILSDVIEEATTLAMFGTRHQNVHLRLHFDPQARVAVINRIQIQQVVVNLVRNAVEAMAESERRELAVSSRGRDDGAIEIEIADSGPGLAPEIAGQLFKPFVTTKPHGMGVGLSICQSIIEAHRGRIWADANPAGGTIFRFTLPGEPAET